MRSAREHDRLRGGRHAGIAVRRSTSRLTGRPRPPSHHPCPATDTYGFPCVVGTRELGENSTTLLILSALGYWFGDAGPTEDNPGSVTAFIVHGIAALYGTTRNDEPNRRTPGHTVGRGRRRTLLYTRKPKDLTHPYSATRVSKAGYITVMYM